MVYQFERLFVVDAGKYTCAFDGGEATTYLDEIRQTTDWYRHDYANKAMPD
jgi:hypothetical protein